MADQAKIDEVKLNLPTWIDELTGWTDLKIGAALDANCQNIFAVCRLFWLTRVSDLTAITDLTDSTSTRPLSQTYAHALDMLRYWDKIGGVDATQISKIKRRYHRNRHPIGLNQYGGTYARTD